MKSIVCTMLAVLLSAGVAFAQNWPQGSGPTGHYHVKGQAAATWSVVHRKNIAWTTSLPETGQSTVTVYGDRVFYSCYAPVSAKTTIAADIIAYCAKANSGEVLWKKVIKAKHPLRLSGCFSDSTSPPAVTDGKHVCFFNASGTIACFDLTGKPLWQLESMAVGRSQPFLIDGKVVYTKQTYMPHQGHFSFKARKGRSTEDLWTQLQALEIATGKVVWTSTCGVNMGCIPLPQKLSSGKPVILVGRGGGHTPPERPHGVSMIDAINGKTLWTLPLDNFMSTQTYSLWNDQALIFNGPEHLWVDANSGKVLKTVNFCRKVSVRKWSGTQYADATETLKFRKNRAITQQSNLCVGDFHYFRAYQHPYLGRIHLKTGTVEYLQLPIQLVREKNKADRKIWSRGDGFRTHDMKNNSGIVVMGDRRSKTNTWGHHASPIMTAVGDHLYLPTLVGTVYCIKWKSSQLDENAVAGINDLGPAGFTWTRASLSFANGKLFARTIKQLICISAE